MPNASRFEDLFLAVLMISLGTIELALHQRLNNTAERMHSFDLYGQEVISGAAI